MPGRAPASLQKDGKVQIIGFGPFTVRQAAASTAALTARNATAVLGDKKKVKAHYRNGKNAGVMVAGPNGLYELLLEVPTPDYLTRLLDVEMKLPRPLTPKILELTMGLPESDPQLDALLADPGAFPLVVELGLPGWVFDGIPPDPNALDYYGEMFGGFHTDVGVDPCAERLLAERLGLGGVVLCPPGCGLADPEAAFDALAALIAPAAGSTAEQARATIGVLLALPYEPPPGLPIESVNGVGTFAIEQRPVLNEVGGPTASARRSRRSTCCTSKAVRWWARVSTPSHRRTERDGATRSGALRPDVWWRRVARFTVGGSTSPGVRRSPTRAGRSSRVTGLDRGRRTALESRVRTPLRCATRGRSGQRLLGLADRS